MMKRDCYKSIPLIFGAALMVFVAAAYAADTTSKGPQKAAQATPAEAGATAQASEAKAAVPKKPKQQKRDYMRIAILDFEGGHYIATDHNYRFSADLTKSIPAMLFSDIANPSGWIRVVSRGG